MDLLLPFLAIMAKHIVKIGLSEYKWLLDINNDAIWKALSDFFDFEKGLNRIKTCQDCINVLILVIKELLILRSKLFWKCCE